MDFDSFRTAVSSHPRTLSFMSAPDCRACDALRPKVEALLARHPGWRFVYVDLAEAPQVGGQLMVFSVPTTVLFVEGREARRFGRNLSMDELDDALVRLGAVLDAPPVVEG